jgi:hypothetical protein
LKPGVNEAHSARFVKPLFAHNVLDGKSLFLASFAAIAYSTIILGKQGSGEACGEAASEPAIGIDGAVGKPLSTAKALPSNFERREI